jgi:hypothetical protein
MTSFLNEELAPIALFVYKRPYHTTKVLNALAKCKESANSILYIFSDGPSHDMCQEDIFLVSEVRRIINSENRFARTIISMSERNQGCAKAITEGINFVVNKHGKIIVLEDDIIVSHVFLEYMNFCLNYFENTFEISSINAYSHNIFTMPEYYFLKGGDCWGWGTWKRGWDLINLNAAQLYDNYIDTGLLEEWETGNLVSTLKSAISSPQNIWDIQWSLSLFVNDKLSIWPGKSYVYNIGYDGTGTNIILDVYKHFILKPRLNHKVNKKYIRELEIEENIVCRKKLIQFHSRRTSKFKKGVFMLVISILRKMKLLRLT